MKPEEKLARAQVGAAWGNPRAIKYLSRFGSAKNHLFIAYSSVLTGSHQLRAYNKWLVEQGELYKSEGSSALYRYCEMYDVDGRKSSEPYYDAIMVMIACSNKSTFDKHFRLKGVSLGYVGDETSYGANNFLFRNKSAVRVKMTPTGQEAKRPEDYSGYKHVLIMGPITSFVMAQIEEMVKSDQKYAFHVQGEGLVVGENGEEIKNFYNGLDSAGNLFANPFNYQADMKHAIKFRNLMQQHASCYAVVLSDEPKYGCTYPDIPGKPKQTHALPHVFGTMYSHIIHALNDSAKDAHKHVSASKMYTNEMTIATVVQDFTDKDNLMSMFLLGLLGLVGAQTPVYLTHKAQFMAMRDGKRFGHKNVKTNGALGMLDFARATAEYWPALKEQHADISFEYNEQGTLIQHKLLSKLFEDILAEKFAPGKHPYVFVHPNDDERIGWISEPSSDDKRVMLFNELLYFPTLNTYYAALDPTHTYLTDVEHETDHTDKKRRVNFGTDPVWNF